MNKDNIYITSEDRTDPDLRKLARALIRIVQLQAQREEEEEKSRSKSESGHQAKITDQVHLPLQAPEAGEAA